MSLIACVVYDPPGEPRTALMRGALQSLAQTVSHNHRLVIVSNGISLSSHDALKELKYSYGLRYHLIETGDNIGTARAINKAWAMRAPGEHCVKVDSDVLIHEPGWLDKLEECIARDPQIGQIGLKRPDLMENPWAPVGDWSHSDLKMLPHNPGQSWLTVEVVRHCMGTAVLHSSALLDRVGYLYQMGAKYGMDDAIMSARSEIAGFYNCFLCNVHIDHPDPGGSRYQSWKEQVSGPLIDRYRALVQDYKMGFRDIRHGPDDP